MSAITWTLKTYRVDDLTDYYKNPRSLTTEQFDQLKKSLDKFGMIDKPIVNLDDRHTVIGGHQRLRVIRADRVSEVECWTPDRVLDEKEVEELNIRLNKNTGAWDFDILANEFEFGDLLEWGFDEKELTGLDFGNEEPPEDPGAQIDKAEELREKWGVETGQLWQLGEHKLICGDCTDRAVVERVMGGEKANLCLTDPPYGLGDGKESGKNDYNQYKDTKENLIKLVAGWLPIAREISPVIVFSPGVTNAWIYPEADWIMCWFYGGGQLRSSWGFNCWQPFLCYGKDPSLASGHGGRPDAIDMNTPANSGDIYHPFPKPLKLWEWFIERLSFEVGDIVYDPFVGSGTTIIACERLGRKCRAVEISPAYVAVSIQRWVDMTGGEPILISD